LAHRSDRAGVPARGCSSIAGVAIIRLDAIDGAAGPGARGQFEVPIDEFPATRAGRASRRAHHRACASRSGTTRSWRWRGHPHALPLRQCRTTWPTARTGARAGCPFAYPMVRVDCCIAIARRDGVIPHLLRHMMRLPGGGGPFWTPAAGAGHPDGLLAAGDALRNRPAAPRTEKLVFFLRYLASIRPQSRRRVYRAEGQVEGQQRNFLRLSAPPLSSPPSGDSRSPDLRL